MFLRWANKNIKYIFSLPAVIFVLVMVGFPILYTVRLGFYEWSMSNVQPPNFVGLSNFATLFSEARFWNTFKNTFLFSGVALFFEMVFGIALALFLNRSFFGKNIVKTLFLLPMVATPVAVGLVWMLIYEPTIGIANGLLRLLGLQPLEWLGAKSTSLMSLALIDIWQWTPMIVLIILAGLSAIPSEPYESAMIDGANYWQSTFRITLPLLKPTILVAMLLRLIDVFKTFDIIYSTTKGGPSFSSETVNIYSFILGFQYFTFGKSSALLLIFFVIILIISLVLIRLKKRMEVEY